MCEADSGNDFWKSEIKLKTFAVVFRVYVDCPVLT